MSFATSRTLNFKTKPSLSIIDGSESSIAARLYTNSTLQLPEAPAQAKMADSTPKQTSKRKHDEVGELEIAVSRADLNGLISSHMITIIAGNEKRRFAVHEYVMKNGSSALAALVSDRWKEGKDKIIDWSDIESSVIVSIIYYLYNKAYDIAGKTTKEDAIANTNDVEKVTANKGIVLRNRNFYGRALTKTSEDGKIAHSTSILEHHVKVYVLADRYLLEELKSLVVTKFTESVGDIQGSTQELAKITKFVYENEDLLVTEDTPVHEALSTVIVEHMTRTEITFDEKAFKPLFKKFPSLLLKISLCMAVDFKVFRTTSQKLTEDITICKSRVSWVHATCENSLCKLYGTIEGKDFFSGSKTSHCKCGLPLDFAFQKESPAFIQRSS